MNIIKSSISNIFYKFDQCSIPMPSFEKNTSEQICISGLAAIGTCALAAVWTHPVAAIVLGIAGGSLALNSKVQKSAARILKWASYKPKMIIETKASDIGARESTLINGKEHTGNARIHLSNGESYVGQIIKGYRSVGTLYFNNGEMFKGNFLNDLPHGFGKYHFNNGDIYEGAFIKNQRTGFGNYRFNDGDVYEGEFINGQMIGFGTYRFNDGEVYEGSFIKNERTGFATYRFNNGEVYEGAFIKDQRTGLGTYRFSNRDIYKGEFINNQITGLGTYRFNNGDVYEGRYVNGKFHGFGRIHYLNGPILRGNFENNCFIGESDDIGQSGFVGALLGLNFIDPNWAAPILSAYLLDSHPEIAKKLNAAAELMRKPDLIKQRAAEVYGNLIDPANFETQVLPFTTGSHAMLLAITPRSDDYIFEIYNSGDGLDKYHDYCFDFGSKGIKTKYRTKLAIQVPLVSAALIEQLLTRQSSIDEAYDLILKLPGAKKLLQDDLNWQSQQKGPNCGIECIFAFLKDKMGAEEYHSMRKALFEKCIELAGTPNDPKSLEFIPELQRKVKKREQKIKMIRLKSATF